MARLIALIISLIRFMQVTRNIIIIIMNCAMFYGRLSQAQFRIQKSLYPVTSPTVPSITVIIYVSTLFFSMFTYPSLQDVKTYQLPVSTSYIKSLFLKTLYPATATVCEVCGVQTLSVIV